MTLRTAESDVDNFADVGESTQVHLEHWVVVSLWGAKVSLAQTFSKHNWAMHAPTIYSQQGTLTAGMGKF